MRTKKKQIYQINILNIPGDENNGKLAFTVDNFLSNKECESILHRLEGHTFQKAVINQKTLDTNIRNNSRTYIEDPKFVNKIWSKLKNIGIIPKTMTNGVFTLNGLYKHIIFYKYNRGEYFREHYDDEKKDLNKKSFFTVLIYLNNDFEGGETTFIHHKKIKYKKKWKDEVTLTPVIPQKGKLLVFKHNILHEGSILKSGIKYILRCDIMYEKHLDL